MERGGSGICEHQQRRGQCRVDADIRPCQPQNQRSPTMYGRSRNIRWIGLCPALLELCNTVLAHLVPPTPYYDAAAVEGNVLAR